MKKNTKHILLNIFILIEIILGIFIQFTSCPIINILQFTSVVIAASFPLLFIKKEKDFMFTQIGLICTVCADLFLVVIKPMYQIPAMCFFSITQICYFLRIYFNQTANKEKLTHLVIRLISSILIIIITFVILKEKTDFLSIISVFYYINLIINIIYSFTQHSKSLLFPIGLLLFACCDLLIGLNILSSSYLKIKNGTLLYYLCNPGFNLAWLFYVPSQTLITTSVVYKEVINETSRQNI